MSDHNVEWRGRSHFAELAEALKVTTDSIMAATEREGWWWVLYTEQPTSNEDDWIWFALLNRDESRVLHVRQERMVERIRDFNGDSAELMRRSTK